jgi:hypothetical protein
VILAILGHLRSTSAILRRHIGASLRDNFEAILGLVGVELRSTWVVRSDAFNYRFECPYGNQCFSNVQKPNMEASWGHDRGLG